MTSSQADGAVHRPHSVAAPPQLQEGGREDILGVVLVADHPQCMPVHALLMGIEDATEGVPISRHGEAPRCGFIEQCHAK